MERVTVGIVGNGNISPIYLKNLTQTFKGIVNLKGVCDLIPERSKKASEEWGVPVIYDTMYDMFADPEIELVVNLTTPNQHYGVAIEALKAGKLAGAGIDVFETEPPIAADHPLMDAPNAVLAPHVAFATFESLDRRARIAFGNVYGWLGIEA